MALVKIEIDGRRMTADGGQTILQVARQHGIQRFPRCATMRSSSRSRPASSAW